jgi:PIN domain nuclease of toxin-antitoxin system
MAGDAPKFVSVVTLWEIAIKASLGKIRMPGDLLQIIRQSDVELLPVMPAHAMHTASLSLHHRDPFDRMLIAQAQVEGLSILTADRQFAAYGIEII